MMRKPDPAAYIFGSFLFVLIGSVVMLCLTIARTVKR